MRGEHMNLLDLGGFLKQERERRGLSVRDVMDATKISRRNLNALEAGEIKLLPHPVYLKGYVRNYARLVGLDPEPLAAVVDQQSDGDSGYVPQIPSPPAVPAPVGSLETLAQQPEAEPSQPEATQSMSSASASAAAPAVSVEPVTLAAVEPLQPEPAAEQPESVESQIRFPKHTDLTPKPRKRLWPWIVLLVLVVGSGGLVYQCQRIQADSPPPPVAAPVVVPMDNATNATEANATAVELEANATLTDPAPSLPAAPAPAVPASAPSAMPELKPVGPGASAPPAVGSVASAPIEVSRKPQAPVQAPAQGSGIETRTVGMQELLVVGKPGEVCWVEVSEGQRRKTFTLRDGDSRRFEFSNKAKVRLGNAGGVTFQLNGSFYPYEGQRGQTAVVEIGAR
jgi:cytoskeleton protein RodZ